MKPIYEPKGLAREYANYALNIYTGCTHGCDYCYAPNVLRKDRLTFGTSVRAREGIVDATVRQLEREDFAGRTVHLCFTCDPYPRGVDTSATSKIIDALKSCGASVQILTKNADAALDLDMLDGSDRFGVTISGGESHERFASPEADRLAALEEAHARGIRTWVSCEPVFDIRRIYDLIAQAGFIDFFAIGKANYVESDIDWAAFRAECERLCGIHGRAYVIKSSLSKAKEARL